MEAVSGCRTRLADDDAGAGFSHARLWRQAMQPMARGFGAAAQAPSMQKREAVSPLPLFLFWIEPLGVGRGRTRQARDPGGPGAATPPRQGLACSQRLSGWKPAGEARSDITPAGSARAAAGWATFVAMPR